MFKMGTTSLVQPKLTSRPAKWQCILGIKEQPHSAQIQMMRGTIKRRHEVVHCTHFVLHHSSFFVSFPLP